jgi:lauroyl/myristoyl acyltransferase
VIQRVRARLSRSLSVGLGWLAAVSPRVAFAAAGTLAALLSIASRRHTRARLRSLFPHLSRADAGGILRRIWTTYARTLMLMGWMRRGGRTSILALVRENEAVRRLRPPMIVSTFHIGPTLSLGVLSERMQGETLVLRGTQFPVDGHARHNVNLIEGNDQQRAATFHRAIERLRQNGFVVLALDPHEAHRIAAPFLGRTLQLARGPFAMARIARVPIVPLVARWAGNEIELIVGEPLPVLDDEQALAASAAQWLESYLRDSPGELSGRILELMREE